MDLFLASIESCRLGFCLLNPSFDSTILPKDCSSKWIGISYTLLKSLREITFAGGGVSFLGATKKNLHHFKKRLSIMSIGPNKLNQKRHILFLKNLKAINNHMQKHAKILRPKFEMVDLLLENGLREKNVGKWSKPKGGYFVSFDSLEGLATEIVSLADQVGLKLTPAGSTFPYGVDPKDNNIRLAPTFPSLEELELAMQIFINCVLLASVRDKITL